MQLAKHGAQVNTVLDVEEPWIPILHALDLELALCHGTLFSRLVLPEPP